MRLEAFLKFFCSVSFCSLPALGGPLAPSKVEFEQKKLANTTIVYELVIFEDGSSVKRPVSLWYETKFPLEIFILNDFTPPSRFVTVSGKTELENETTPLPKVELETTGRVRHTGLAIVLSELNDSTKQELYKNCDSAKEWTAAARLVDENAVHRPIHNVPSALSGNGVQAYFNTGYVVCVEKKLSHQPAPTAFKKEI